MTIEKTEADLVTFIRGVVQLSAPLAARQRVGLVFRPGESCRMACFDADKLEKILLELISHVLKFSSANGQVAVAAQCDTTYARVTVEGSGNGIAGKVSPFTLEAASTVKPLSQSRLEECGLGLAQARELVQMHGGSVTVQTPAHSASTDSPVVRFEIMLPLGQPIASIEPMSRGFSASLASSARPFEGSTPPPSLPIQLNGGSQPLILVVEDNAELAAYFHQRLGSRYRVLVLDNTDIASAIAKIREMLPDFVIAEFALQGLDGIELCRRIRCHERTSHTPVILLTAQYLEVDHARALEAGADDYLPKPFSTSLLLARIHNLIESRRRLLERFRQQFIPRDVAVASPDSQFVHRVCEIIEQHLSDSRFNAEDLARNLALSRRQLFRKFKGLTGQTPHGFLRSMRLERAAQLLRGSEMTVMQITFAVGFDDLKHFRTVFRQRFGVLPSEFAKAPRSDLA